MAWNTITLKGYTFTDKNLLDGDAYLSSAINPEQMEYDTLTIILSSATFAKEECFLPLGATGLNTATGLLLTRTNYPSLQYLLSIPYGTEILWSRDVLKGKFYVKNAVRVGKYAVKINCISAAGYLQNSTHYGGVYSGDTVSTVLADVIDGAVPYTLEGAVGATPLFGWLPIGTKMSNLHQVLFAIGAQIMKDSKGDMHIIYPAGGTPAALSDNAFYYGGTLDYKPVASRVEVTEHAFYALPTDVLYTLFDNTDGSGAAVNQLVKFDSCYHDVTAVGCVISEVNQNHMIVNGTGVVTGLKYTHTQRVLEKSNPIAQGENVVQITDAMLVSIANSKMILDRVYDYHTKAEEIKSGLQPGDNLPGAQLLFVDPFGDRKTGFLKSMDVVLSHVLMSDAVILAGYLPKYYGNNFKNITIIASSGNWVVPDGITRISVAVFSGGQGGQSGLNGEDSPQPAKEIGSSITDKVPTYWNGHYFGLGGAGGTAGSGGAAGKILRADIDVTPGQIIPVTIGTGGAGGAYSAGAQTSGAYGADSTFGAFSSSTGAIPTGGFKDIFSGATYAVSGVRGIPGGSGTGWSGNKENHSEIADGSPVKDPDGTIRTPGATIGTPYENQDGGRFNYNGTLYVGNVSGAYSPGRGGGAAAGVNGNPSANTGGRIYLSFGGPSFLDICAFSTSSSGGNGANALLAALAQTTIGSGGHGGHGGGGAGGTGFVVARIRDVSGNVKSAARGFSGDPSPNLGGTGTSGGNGAPGGVIIYY